MKKRPLIFHPLALLFSLAIGSASGDSATWIGTAADNDWANDNNWTVPLPPDAPAVPAAVPGTGDTATFSDLPAAGVTVFGGLALKDLVINSTFSHNINTASTSAPILMDDGGSLAVATGSAAQSARVTFTGNGTITNNSTTGLLTLNPTDCRRGAVYRRCWQIADLRRPRCDYRDQFHELGRYSEQYCKERSRNPHVFRVEYKHHGRFHIQRRDRDRVEHQRLFEQSTQSKRWNCPDEREWKHQPHERGGHCRLHARGIQSGHKCHQLGFRTGECGQPSQLHRDARPDFPERKHLSTSCKQLPIHEPNDHRVQRHVEAWQCHCRRPGLHQFHQFRRRNKRAVGYRRGDFHRFACARHQHQSY